MKAILPNFDKITLKNGLEIYHTPVNLGSGVISVDVYYKVGSRNEIMGKSGIAHMLEHLNFKSTKNLKAGEFDEIVKGFGGVNNASTGFDYTHYFVKCSSQNLDKTLGLYADIMSNLSLKDEEFQPERDVVLEERRWRTDNNPMGFLFFRLFNNAFIYHPYHWTPIGFYGDIENWEIDDIRNFHKTYYQPQNAFIMITGDCDKDSVFELARKHFENIKNSTNLPKFHYKEPEQNGEKRVILHKDSEVEMLAIAYKTPNFKNKDQIALNAISSYLENGKSSILQQILVDEKNLVNNINVYNLDLIDDGLFIILAICNPGIDALEVESEILKIIENLKLNTIDASELTKIKNRTKANFIYSLESATKVANLYGEYIAKGDINPLLSYQDDLENLNLDEIKRVAKEYFNKKSSTTIILRKESNG